VTPSGQLSIVAGKVGQSGRPTAGPATSTELGDPAGVAVSSSTGDLYIADAARQVIEEITPAGALSIFAGRINHTNVPTAGPATSSDLNSPSGVAVDPTTGDVYIADSGNASVDEVTPAGQISVLAGSPGNASVPIPGPATGSNLDGDLGVAVDNSGDVFIADTRNDVVEEVTAAGDLSVLTGKTFTSGTPTAGLATSSELNSPAGVAVDPATGDIFVADTGNSLIEQVTPAGQLSTVAGRSGFGPPIAGPSFDSPLNGPSAVAVNPTNGIRYIADSTNNVIEAVNAGDQLVVMAGEVGKSGKPRPGFSTISELKDPTGVAVDSTTGNLYIADSGNDTIDEVTPAGQLSIVAGVAGKAGLPTPGPATTSDLKDPTGVAVNSSTGDLYIADSGNQVVEQVTPSGQLSIIAGNPGNPGLPTAGPAGSSHLDTPEAVAVDSTTGDVFIADEDNDSIQQVTPSGQVSVPVTASAGLDSPSGVAVDPSTGNVFISSTYADVVLELTPAGRLSTVAGQLQVGGSPPPGRATSSRLNDPKGLAFDPTAGSLYIADSGNNNVEQVLDPAPAPAPTVSGVSPDSGPVGGNTTITVRGTGFVSGATVLITQGHGTSTAISATDVLVLSSTKLTAVTTGDANAGKWNVLVVEPAGASVANIHNRYDYLPTVSSVSPRRGPTAGATHITIKGTGFVKGARVVISQRRGTTKAIKAKHVKVVSSTRITVITGGKAKPGTWNVFVLEHGVTSAAVSGDHYRYTK
jgi:DNA-binding beta-propeller fold protein YncE